VMYGNLHLRLVANRSNCEPLIYIQHAHRASYKFEQG
jgi:hypothetical protein